MLLRINKNFKSFSHSFFIKVVSKTYCKISIFNFLKKKLELLTVLYTTTTLYLKI